jgi:WD40 repeat protein
LVLPINGCCFALQPDDEHIYIGDTRTGRLISSIQPPQPTLPFVAGDFGGFGDTEFSTDGRTFVTFELGRGVTLWRIPEKQFLQHIEGGVGWLFVDDGDILAVTTTKFSVELFRSSTGHPLATLTGHTAAIRNMWFSKDGTKLATASDDRTVRIWQIPS